VSENYFCDPEEQSSKISDFLAPLKCGKMKLSENVVDGILP
jgi:hypothetical protein